MVKSWGDDWWIRWTSVRKLCSRCYNLDWHSLTADGYFRPHRIKTEHSACCCKVSLKRQSNDYWDQPHKIARCRRKSHITPSRHDSGALSALRADLPRDDCRRNSRAPAAPRLRTNCLPERRKDTACRAADGDHTDIPATAPTVSRSR